jgi:hypothetical protein
MSTDLVVWTLTALCAAVVVVTRLRLGRSELDGPAVSPQVLTAHTVVGTLTVLLWAVFLAFPADSVLGSAEVGIVAVGGWWLTAILGLVLLARWRRPKGRHSGHDHDAASTYARVLSAVGHVGLFLASVWFTWAYLFSVV